MEFHQRPERDKYCTHWILHLPMLLDTIKEGFSKNNINSNNTSAVGQIVKNAYECVARVAWERGCTNGITLCMLWGELQVIM